MYIFHVCEGLIKKKQAGRQAGESFFPLSLKYPLKKQKQKKREKESIKQK